MVLYDSVGVLEEEKVRQAWIDVTQDRIHEKTLNIIGDDGDGLVIDVSLDDSEALEGQRRLLMPKCSATTTPDASTESGVPKQHYEYLQSYSRLNRSNKNQSSAPSNVSVGVAQTKCYQA